jgi:hypothetical protein
MTIFRCCVLAVGMCLVGCRSADPVVSLGLDLDRVEQTRATIRALVADEDRQASLLAIVDAMQAGVAALDTEAVELREQIVVANRSYETTREDLTKQYDALGALIAQLGEVVKLHSLELRAGCTADEWAKIAVYDANGFEFHF